MQVVGAGHEAAQAQGAVDPAVPRAGEPGVDQAAHGLAHGEGAGGFADLLGDRRDGGDLVALRALQAPEGLAHVVGGAGQRVPLFEEAQAYGLAGRVLGRSAAEAVAEDDQGAVPVLGDVGDPGGAVGERAGETFGGGGRGRPGAGGRDGGAGQREDDGRGEGGEGAGAGATGAYGHGSGAPVDAEEGTLLARAWG